MEKEIKRYYLLLCSWMKKGQYWVEVVFMLFVLLLISGIQMRDEDSMTTGICPQSSSYAKQIAEVLKEDTDSAFQFLIYTDQERMKQDILDGKTQCGFIFLDDFDEKIREGNLKRSVLFFTTPFSSKGIVMKETMNRVIFQIQSEKILLRSEEKLYGDKESKRSEYLLEENRKFSGSDVLLQLNVVRTQMLEQNEDGTNQPAGETENQATENQAAGNQAAENQGSIQRTSYPLQGIAATILFLMILMASARKFDQDFSCVLQTMPAGRRKIFLFENALAAGTVPACCMTVFLAISGESRGAATECIRMLLLLLTSSIISMMTASIIKKMTTFMAFIPLLLILTLVCCPVLADISSVFPCVRPIRIFLPVGLYLW